MPLSRGFLGELKVAAEQRDALSIDSGYDFRDGAGGSVAGVVGVAGDQSVQIAGDASEMRQ